MESRVRVKILREICLNGRDIEREPVGWFHFEGTSQFETLPEIFLRFVQQHLKRTECCKHSSSQIIIIFEKEEEEWQNIDPKISDWIKNVCSMEPQEGELKNIYYPRLWREYKEQRGLCFSCGEILECIGPCHFYKMDFIVLEEMTHFGNAWNNWGNSIFISNSMPTITSRGEVDAKFLSEIFTKCMAICSPMHSVEITNNQWNMYRQEEKNGEPPGNTYKLRTWNNLTTPLNYAAAARIRECGNPTSTSISLLEELCLKAVFSIFEKKMFKENNRLNPEKYQQLPLPQMMISKMMRIFTCAQYLSYVRERLCA